MNISYPIKEWVCWDPLLLMVLHAADDSVIQLHIFECYIWGGNYIIIVTQCEIESAIELIHGKRSTPIYFCLFVLFGKYVGSP